LERAVSKITRTAPDNVIGVITRCEAIPEKKIEEVFGEDEMGELIRERIKRILETHSIETIGDLLDFIKTLASSKTKYYSKWNGESPFEFFDAKNRFSFADPRQMYPYWYDALRAETPIITQDLRVSTWKDLMRVLGKVHGDDAIMGISEFCQGSTERPLREGIRLAPNAPHNE
jgi:hypothetical protein